MLSCTGPPTDQVANPPPLSPGVHVRHGVLQGRVGAGGGGSGRASASQGATPGGSALLPCAPAMPAARGLATASKGRQQAGRASWSASRSTCEPRMPQLLSCSGQLAGANSCRSGSTSQGTRLLFGDRKALPTFELAEPRHAATNRAASASWDLLSPDIAGVRPIGGCERAMGRTGAGLACRCTEDAHGGQTVALRARQRQLLHRLPEQPGKLHWQNGKLHLAVLWYSAPRLASICGAAAQPNCFSITSFKYSSSSATALKAHI